MKILDLAVEFAKVNSDSNLSSPTAIPSPGPFVPGR